MPHFPHTPEALLGRNDSKNAATTCKGITSSGRPCRRALASLKSSTISRRKAGVGGVVALVEEDGEIAEADFYCWQHKEQAERRVQDEKTRDIGRNGRRLKKRSTELFPLQERSSIDTLVQRLGLDSASEPPTRTNNPKPPKRTETNDFAASQAPYAEKYSLGSGVTLRPKQKKQSFWASLCCMADDDDYVEIVRHKKRKEQSQPPEMTTIRPTSTLPRPSNTASIPARKPVTSLPLRPAPNINSQTNHLLSLIPTKLSPQTTSALLAELTKPISPYDEEGYIYIFWLTPQTKTAPPESTARSLLSTDYPHSRASRLQHTRRISDVMTEFSYDGADDVKMPRNGGDEGRAKRTIMLKIGRASNITRRMNEWQRQCGYALNLVRWYPYVSSSPLPSPQPENLYPDLSRPPSGRRQSSDVHKVPNVKRVERLVHLELAENQVKRHCTACGKEHREWFQVDASQAGLKAVDETVRRWVAWAERQAVT